MYLHIYLSISLCLSLSSSRPRPSPGISYTAEHSKYLRSHSGDESSLIFRVGGQKKKKKVTVFISIFRARLTDERPRSVVL